MPNCRLAIVVLAVLRLSTAGNAGEPQKYALLVGVTKYSHTRMNDNPLRFPEADATAVQQLLKASGYETEVLLGDRATREAVSAALTLASRKGNADGVVFIGLFGHGVQYEQDAYFCPFDAEVREVVDSQGKTLHDKDGRLMLEPDPDSLVALRNVLNTLTKCGAGNKVIFADCCRNDPSAARGRAFGSELKVSDLPPGTAALFSCSRNEQAFEHDDWGHGAFTRSFLDEAGRLSALGSVKAGTLSDCLSESVLALVQSKGRERQTVNPIINGTVDLRLQLMLPLLTSPFSAAEVRTARAATARSRGVPETASSAIGLQLNLIPAGTFLMGGDQSPEEIVRVSAASGVETKAEFYADEQPPHMVRITQPFYLGVYEVTQREWQAVLGSNPSYFAASGGGKDSVTGLNTSDCPVETVSWYDAVEFCNQLSQRDGLLPYYTLTGVERDEGSIKDASVSVTRSNGYRLPTEAEWEYACRAGTTTPFHFGSSSNGTQANIDGNYPYGTSTKGPYLQRPTSVGKYSANAFGLHDLHGNVREWCFDGYDEHAYQSRSGATADPVVTSSPENRRVLRGGSWNDIARYSRSAERNRYAPDVRYGNIGFRVARTP